MTTNENDAVFIETTVKSVWFKIYNCIWRAIYCSRRNAARKINARIYAFKKRLNQPKLVVVEHNTARR